MRALGVYAAMLPHGTKYSELKTMGVAGVILSGGPASVYSDGAPAADPETFRGDLPLLGICYGYQLMVRANGGEVTKTERREYGRTIVTVRAGGGLLDGMEGGRFDCWMSHSDSATRIPETLEVLASSDSSPYAAVRLAGASQYGVQFHPEVSHTQNGQAVLSNFVLGICRAEKRWSLPGAASFPKACRKCSKSRCRRTSTRCQ